jgi:replicative DNA helicase
VTAAELPREPAPTDDELPAPPHDILAEMSVLGAMMLTPIAVPDVIDQLQPRDFYRPNHQTIYTCIVDLYSRGQPCDAIAIAQALGIKALVRAGGATYLHDLLQAVPTAANAGYYAAIIARKALQRRMVEAGVRIAQIGQQADDDALDDALDRAQAEMYGVTGQRDHDAITTAAGLLQATLDGIEARGNGAEPDRLPTGFSDLDGMMHGGLKDGQLVVIAARPAIGKSTLGLDIVRACAIHHAATAGGDALIFSLEMSRDEIMQRLLAAEARVGLTNILTGKVSDDDWARLGHAAGRVAEARVHIDDSGSLSIADIRTRARRVAQQCVREGRQLRLIVVDYIQLVTSPGRVESRQVEVAGFSRALKLLAKDLGLPVIGISQLNRGPEQRADKTPGLADLRESGAIENDADAVVLLYREDAYYKPGGTGPRQGEADLILAKNRNGPTGTATVAFQGHYARFVDMATTH